MKWNIIADSSCDLKELETHNPNINFEKVPFVFHFGNKEFVDNEKLSLDQLLDEMASYSGTAKTSCPSSGDWYNLFKKEGNVIAITISHGVSGSYQNAVNARQMVLEEEPDKKICIIDSYSAGSVLSLIALEAERLINEGKTFEEIAVALEEYRKQRQTMFALCSFNNLVKNGRVSRLSGFLAGILGIWGIGVATPEGTIGVKTKTRGMHKVISILLQDMKDHLFNGGRVIITHVLNLELANKLAEAIKETFKNAKVLILESQGLCSFYAEKKGLILGY